MFKLFVIIAVTLFSLTANAHTLPDFCTADGDLEAECGGQHTCDFRSEVSEEIGVCQSEVEGSSFQTCDFTKGDEDCPEDFICRIGQLSTVVGACIEDDSQPPEPVNTTDDEDEGCSAVGAGPTIWLVLLMFGFRRRKWLPAVLLAALSLGCSDDSQSTTKQEPLECTSSDQTDLFLQRIEPLISEDRPSSCMRCHLPGTDFSEYVVPNDPCATMLCLYENGLVNLQKPEDSKMLGWILRGHDQSESRLIDDQVVNTEYEAFKQWIEFSSRCGPQVCEPIENPCGYPVQSEDMGIDFSHDVGVPDIPPDLPPPPDLTIENYGCDEDSLAQAYYDHPFYWRGRCNHCHIPNAITNNPGPEWMSSQIGLEGARETMLNQIDRGHFNTEEPLMSLALLKPLGEEDGGVEHGGGRKMLVEDDLYVDFLNFANLLKDCEAQE